VVVGRDEEDAHALAQPGAPGIGHLLGMTQLLMRGQQVVAVHEGPRVVLHVGELEELGSHLVRHRDDPLDVWSRLYAVHHAR
jgi:hypothetical protein